jgi:hypothetical protein
MRNAASGKDCIGNGLLCLVSLCYSMRHSSEKDEFALVVSSLRTNRASLCAMALE